MTTAADSARLARVRRHGTGPELAVRRAASALQLRYTLDNRDLPGSPDLANRSKQFAIFVHGCFWHRHTGCIKTTTPKTNRAFWRAKFERNRARDRSALRALRARGYAAVVIWECEVADSAMLKKRLESQLRRRPSHTTHSRG
jgi:DNA mismatch endonuclease (patch repair protein)